MGKEIVNQVEEVQRVSGRINPRRNTLGHMLNKLPRIKDKDTLLKETRGKKQITYKGNPIRISQQKL